MVRAEVSRGRPWRPAIGVAMNESRPRFVAIATDPYPRRLVVLHWLMAVLLVGMLIIGSIMAGRPLGDELRSTLVLTHLAVGLVVFALAAWRLVIRLRGPKVRAPTGHAAWRWRLAGMVHGIFYGLMLGLPVLGLAVWLIDPFVPGPGLGQGRLWLTEAAGRLHRLHYLGGWLLLVLMVLHIAAALSSRASLSRMMRVSFARGPG